MIRGGAFFGRLAWACCDLTTADFGSHILDVKGLRELISTQNCPIISRFRRYTVLCPAKSGVSIKLPQLRRPRFTMLHNRSGPRRLRQRRSRSSHPKGLSEEPCEHQDRASDAREYARSASVCRGALDIPAQGNVPDASRGNGNRSACVSYKKQISPSGSRSSAL